jgi:LDH2 family malate/lactate/ureidoglycolate dehydrogenase
MSIRIEPDALIDFASEVYEKAGVPAADARLISDTLVQADLWGHQSHGVLRLGWYLARIRTGAMSAVTEPEFVMDRGGVAVVDGHDGVGQVLATFAMKEAIRRAKLHGIGAVGVRNSNHFGTAMYYSLMAPRQACVSMLTTNASPSMAPWGGREKIVGNNPWSIAAPAGRHAPMMLDIANTGVARGKVYLARQRGESIPAGWAINAAGEPTTDAQEAIDGIILPMAQHKGYVIAMLMDMLAGVLTGSGFGAQVNGPYQAEKKSHCGHLVIAMDVAAFQAPSEFDARMEQLIAAIKAVPVAKGFDEVFYPGEIEARNDVKHRAEGIALPGDTLADLRKVASETGVSALFLR